MFLADLGHEVHARAVGQAHVGEAEIIGIRRELGTRVGEGGGCVASQAHAAQRHDEQFADVALVVDYQCTTCIGHPPLRATR
jgi:hypothetical protein